MPPAAESARWPLLTLSLRLQAHHFDPDEVTRRLGVAPSKVWRKGEPMTASGSGRHLRTVWDLRVGPSETLHAEPLLQDLRARLKIEPSLVRRTAEDLNLTTLIYLTIQTQSIQMPAIQIPPDISGWIHVLGAELGIDIFLLSESVE